MLVWSSLLSLVRLDPLPAGVTSQSNSIHRGSRPGGNVPSRSMKAHSRSRKIPDRPSVTFSNTPSGRRSRQSVHRQALSCRTAPPAIASNSLRGTGVSLAPTQEGS
jgi:hypothetical protein